MNLSECVWYSDCPQFPRVLEQVWRAMMSNVPLDWEGEVLTARADITVDNVEPSEIEATLKLWADPDNGRVWLAWTYFLDDCLGHFPLPEGRITNQPLKERAT